MTYDDAEIMVADNLHLAEQFSPLKEFPFYVHCLIIVPAESDASVQTKVYKAYVENGGDNKEALSSTGTTGDDFEVFIIGANAGSAQIMLLEKYLEALHYKS